jgi:hypothetical protein
VNIGWGISRRYCSPACGTRERVAMVTAKTFLVEWQHTDGTADSDKITEVVVAEIVNGTGQQGG